MTSTFTTNPAAATAPRATVYLSIGERVRRVISFVSDQHYLFPLALGIVWTCLSALGRFAELLASWKQPGVPVPAVESLPTIEHLERPPEILLLLDKAEPPDDHPNLRTSRADNAPEFSGTTNSQLTYTPRSPPFVPPTPPLEDLIDESSSLSDSGLPSQKTHPYVSPIPSRIEVTSADAESASLNHRIIPRTHIVHSVARVPVRHVRTRPDLTPIQRPNPQSIPRTHIVHSVARVPVRHVRTGPDLAPIQRSNPQSSTDDPSAPSPFAEWTPFIPAGNSKGGDIKKLNRNIDVCGGFSDVFRAEIRFRAPAAGPELMQYFALRIRRVGLDGREEHQMLTYMNAQLTQEIITWIGLAHPNVVPLVGFTISPLPALITPWYQEGNIRSYLNRHPHANRLKLIHGVARGLEYLHSQSPSIAYGDIKPGNVLVNEQGDALLSDLGLATFLGDEPSDTASHHVGGSLPHTAPELFLGEQRTCSADVYSFASLAFEVFTDHLPHSSLKNNNMIVPAMGNPEGPEYSVDDWSEFPQLKPIEDILCRCWSRRPEDRPSMKDIAEKLSILVRGADA